MDSWADRVACLPAGYPEQQWPPPDWILFEEGGLRVAYTAMDWVNPAADIALIGITPGRHQAWRAAIEAGAALRQGANLEEALRRADRIGSFSGPMRANLVGMLNGLGAAEALGIIECADLFTTEHHRCGFLSATGFPVFVNGANYNGAAPPLLKAPALRSLVRQMLGGDVLLMPNALLVPLGEAARAAVEILIEDGLVERQRCLMGVPHLSGANGHRLRQYRDRAPRLRAELSAWAQERKRNGAWG